MHTPGAFCTSVLRARDLDRAADFYGSLMGWTTQPTSADHRFFQCRGKTVASLLRVAGNENAWAPHVSVENLEDATARATALGATLVDTIEIGGVARTATFRDSEASMFGLWQPAPHGGAELSGEVGSLWWIEVLPNDVAAARDLYTRLFDWTAADTAFAPFDRYIFLKQGERNVSGILPIDGQWPIAPRWNSIFAVEDCDATVSRALQSGACEDYTHTVPDAGRIAVFRDPDRAIFLVRGPVPERRANPR